MWYFNNMGKLFLLLIGLYICSFIYNNLGLSSNSFNFNFNFSKYVDIFIAVIAQTYRYAVNSLLLLSQKINNIFNKIEKYLPVLKSKNYLLIALAVHIIGLFLGSKYIMFKGVEKAPEWVYVEISTKDIEEKAVADFDKTIELAPQDARGFSQRATTRVKMDDAKGAEFDFNKAL